MTEQTDWRQQSAMAHLALASSDNRGLQKAADKIVVCTETQCWLYNGWHNRGYPTVARRINGKMRYYTAHRYFYENLVEPIPAGKVILHKCDTPNCCNPDHLVVGTQSDNMRDMHRKGRGKTSGGKPAFPKEVRDAAIVLLRHGVLQSALAEAIGCSQAIMTAWKKREEQ